ncbi:hypothetical protein FACS1894147_05160 [Spirochaetia bacterium]|nr:hypothetical protein FACS1894147_05160 [Spirochaetia bacterium]
MKIINRIISYIFINFFHKQLIIVPIAASKSNADMFSYIYENNKWDNGKVGGGGAFYSGPGSHDPELINEYIELLRKIIRLNNIKSICDVGCGDFNVMKQVIDNNILYNGIDVVDKLIEYNNNTYGQDNMKFKSLDATIPDAILPDADLVIARQILQHLDNKSIMILIEKFRKYKYVLITEDIFINASEYNIDKLTGSSIRINSGVVPEMEPFNLKNTVTLLLVRKPEAKTYLRTTLTINY